MTYSLLHANPFVAGVSTGTSISVACTSTTAHNLLVACAATNNSGWSMPAGWIAATPTAGQMMWYYPDCPAGITSVLFSYPPQFGGSTGTGAGAACVLEFTDSAGTNTSPLDVIGSVNVASGATSPQSIPTSAAAAAHDLAVSLGFSLEATASKDSLVTASGSGFTLAANFGNGVKQAVRITADYQPDTASGIVTDSMTFVPSGATSFVGLIATFKIASAAAPAGPPPAVLSTRSPAAAAAALSSGGSFT